MDHIEPLFADLTTIHSNYLFALTEIREMVSQDGSKGENVRATLKKKQIEFAPLRIKVQSLGSVIYSSNNSNKHLKSFAKAVKNYFVLTFGSGETGYKTLLDFIGWYSWNERTKSDADSEIEEVIQCIESRWQELTQAYAEAKTNLLKT